MIQPGTGKKQIPFYTAGYAADNGCFNPKDYIGDDAWLEWVEGLQRKDCLFVVIPDVARRPDGSLGGDPEATWMRFCRLAPAVREMGFPVALAAQDGIERMSNLGTQLKAIDCLFLGGSTAWKVSNQALGLAKRAKRMGLWTHMGRVNTKSRYLLCCRYQIDSCDGTFLKYGPDKNAIRLDRWIKAGRALEEGLAIAEAA